MKRILISALCITASIGSGQKATTLDPQYAKDGTLVLPANYREWVFLSSGLGMTYGPAGQTDAANNPRFDNVFVSPPAYKSFLQTGRWPDKTMFILEIRGSASKASINKGGRFQTGVTAIEAEVKDAARFPETKWTFFGFTGDKSKQLPTSASCYSCHSKNGAVDNTFVQFYPTLLEVAKQKGTLKASYSETPNE